VFKIEIDAQLIGEQHPTKVGFFKQQGSGLGWLVMAACLWGTVGVAGGLLQRVETTPSLTVGFLRMAFSAPFLLGLTWLTTGRSPLALLRLNRREWGLFSLMGLAMASYQLFYFTAIPLSSVTLVVVVALCSSPLLVALLSIPIFKERLTRRVVFALGLALSGTGLLAFGGGSGGEFFKPEYLLGALLALGAGLSYSCFTILSKLATLHSQRGPIQTVTVAFSLSVLILLPMAWFSGNLRLNLAPAVWGLAAYMGLIPTGLAYIIFLRGLKKASATAAAITTLLEPAIAALLAWILLNESLSLFSVGGAFLLLGSVLLLTRR
jgi:DME family drug/metabolite transporter